MQRRMVQIIRPDADDDMIYQSLLEPLAETHTESPPFTLPIRKRVCFPPSLAKKGVEAEALPSRVWRYLIDENDEEIT